MNFKKVAELCYISADFEESNAAVVVLCGWADGKLKQVVKYGEMYSKMGFRVLILLSLMNDLLLKPRSWIHSSSFDAVKDMLNANTILLVEIMSNGGAFSWYAFEDHFNRTLVPRAMIFDSCPSVYSPERKPPTITFFFPSIADSVGKIVDFCMIPFYFCLGIWFKLFPHRNLFNQIAARFIDGQPTVPKLFLYSASDTVVTANDIEDTIKRAKEVGTMVIAHDFKHSHHVQHLRMFPNQYESFIEDFLRGLSITPIKI